MARRPVTTADILDGMIEASGNNIVAKGSADGTFAATIARRREDGAR
jgi:hypothetical protein